MIATEDTAEILTQEGESGLETVGFSGATTLDIQKRRGRPTNSGMFYNWTNTLVISSVYPLPVAYWGNFATLFDGTIVAGTRLDGQGIGFAGFIGSFMRCFADGLGGGVITPPQPSNYLPPTYTFNTQGIKGSLAGIDVFFRTSMTDVNVFIQYLSPPVAFPIGFNIIPIVVNKVPQIGNLVPGIVVTKRRPEGYSAGEDGVQVFFNPIMASPTIPPGFIDPATVGVPTAFQIDNGGNHLRMDLIP
jgi:hypothetical protein